MRSGGPRRRLASGRAAVARRGGTAGWHGGVARMSGGAWVCGRVGAWARGRVGAWVRGCVGAWVRGCVGT